jgi:hypothetical protein
MSLNARNIKSASKGPEQPALDSGSYPARTVQIIDLGVQPQRPFKGEEKPPAHEVMLTYEFADEFMLDEAGEEIVDKPRWLSETFPLRSLDADLATSTKRYKALDPKEDFGGDFTQLIDIPCTVLVVQNAGTGKNVGKVYTNIQSLSAMRPRDAAKAPELINPPKVFVLDEPDMEVFLSLPQWLQDKIKGNLDFDGSALQEALEGPQGKPKANTQPNPKAIPKKSPQKPVEEPEDDEGEPTDGDW